MTTSPFFTIVLPVHNVAPWLGAALASLQAQIFSDWECLAIDDASTDASLDVLIAASQRDSRFRVIEP